MPMTEESMRTTVFLLAAFSSVVAPMGGPAANREDRIDRTEARSLVGTPDGKLWISSHNDIRIWDAATGRLVRTMEPDDVKDRVIIIALRVTGDSKTVWAMTPWSIEGYTIASGKLIFQVKSASVLFCSFDVSRDGKYVAAGVTNNEVRFYDTATEKVVHTIKGVRTTLTAMEAAGRAAPGLDQPVGMVSLSPDGKMLAMAALFDWTVRVFDIQTGKQLHAFSTNNPSYCGHAVFSPDSKFLATSRFTGPGYHKGKEVISIWDLKNGKWQEDFVEGAFAGFGVSADWKWMAAAGTDLLKGEWNGEIHVWERATGKRRCAIVGSKHNAYSRLAFSHDGKTLVGCNQYGIEMWDARTGKKMPFDRDE
jgi:WD40 repeat protein